jgi:signal transduction histidine kinase
MSPMADRPARGTRGRARGEGAAASARDEYLQLLWHELRNPLVGISAAATVLSKQLPDGSVEAQRAAAIAGEASHMLALLQEVTEIAEIETGRLRSVLVPTDLVALVRTALRTQHLGDHELSLIGDDIDVEVLADDRRIRQVIANLLANAVAYSPPGTAIEVRLEPSADPGAARVSVRDHGPGIPPHERARLFTKFARLSTAEGTRGTGLGLYICRELVRDHGGELRAEFPPDGGSMFSFALQAVSQSAAVPAARRAARR